MKTFKEFLLMESPISNGKPKWDRVTYLDKQRDDIDAFFRGLKELPFDFSSFDVKGGFYCNDNKLTSLKGSPKEVREIFSCSNNKITSLKGSPGEVGEYFDCSNNQLISLEGMPNKIGGDFFCLNNPELFEVSPILNSKIEGKIYYTKEGKDEVSNILNKYKNNPRNLIKMLAELKKINERFC